MAEKVLLTDKNTLICSRSGNDLFVKTHYNETQDLIQRFIGFEFKNHRKNAPFDWCNMGLIEKGTDSMEYTTWIADSLDAAAPFGINNSWIGANHGQSNAVKIKSPNHGKTNEDVGSVWLDDYGYRWNLLRIEDEDTLLFLSENVGKNKLRYQFIYKITGVLQYDHKKKNNFAKHKDPIRECGFSALEQVFSAIRKKELTVYAINSGVKTEVRDNDITSCESVEIVERYDVINPSTIAEALRKNRPEGGYKEEPSLAIGEAMVECNLIRTITPDGTLTEKFNHKILQNVPFRSYGNLQYYIMTSCFGGKAYRYIPKLNAFTTVNSKTGESFEYDFRTPFCLDDNDYPAGEFQVTEDLYEDRNNAPDRAIDFFTDEEGNVKMTYATGYLPVLGGTKENRIKNTDAWGFMYKTKKMYPYFVHRRPFEKRRVKNFKIEGASFRKFTDVADQEVSVVSVPYEKETYIYIDCHKPLINKKVALDEKLRKKAYKEIEKSQNITYSIKNNELTFTMKDGKYGYIVLKA